MCVSSHWSPCGELTGLDGLGRRSVRAWQCGTYNATTSDYIQRSRTNWEKLNNYVSDDDDGNVAGSGKRTANLRPTSVHGRKV